MAATFEVDLPAKEKLVMLCLADSSDHFGVCFPSVTTLSRKSSLPERTLQRVLGRLIERGCLETFWAYTDKIRHKKIRHYRLKLNNLETMPVPSYANCPPALRTEVILRFSSRCTYCGRSGTDTADPDGRPWEVDRIVPGSRGGQYVAENVTLSCKSCNMGKGAKLAPSETQSLGAILDAQGCQNDAPVVPLVAPESLGTVTRTNTPPTPPAPQVGNCNRFQIDCQAGTVTVYVPFGRRLFRQGEQSKFESRVAVRGDAAFGRDAGAVMSYLKLKGFRVEFAEALNEAI